jgi:hypothetical protein
MTLNLIQSILVSTRLCPRRNLSLIRFTNQQIHSTCINARDLLNCIGNAILISSTHLAFSTTILPKMSAKSILLSMLAMTCAAIAELLSCGPAQYDPSQVRIPLISSMKLSRCSQVSSTYATTTSSCARLLQANHSATVTEHATASSCIPVPTTHWSSFPASSTALSHYQCPTPLHPLFMASLSRRVASIGGLVVLPARIVQTLSNPTAPRVISRLSILGLRWLWSFPAVNKLTWIRSGMSDTRRRTAHTSRLAVSLVASWLTKGAA